MKLDEMQDIKILRNELKTNMVKCIKTFVYDNKQFNKGEYYYIDFNDQSGEIFISDSNQNKDDTGVFIEWNNKIIEECFGADYL